MKRIIFFIATVLLLAACNNEPNLSKTDKRLLGKWEVKYSKMIYGVWPNDDGSIRILDDAWYLEYNGDYETLSGETWMFWKGEYAIEIKNNFELICKIKSRYDDSYTHNFEIKEPGKITIDRFRYDFNYHFNNDTLIIENIRVSDYDRIYTISKYLKTE